MGSNTVITVLLGLSTFVFGDHDNKTEHTARGTQRAGTSKLKLVNYMIPDNVAVKNKSRELVGGSTRTPINE